MPRIAVSKTYAARLRAALRVGWDELTSDKVKSDKKSRKQREIESLRRELTEALSREAAALSREKATIFRNHQLVGQLNDLLAQRQKKTPEEQLQDSEAKGELTKDWWNNAHAGDIVTWLSGYHGPEIWRRLEVEEKIGEGVEVLNIGVGLGHCTRDLVARGCNVTALDISEVALARVADIARTRKASEIALLPENSFDLALSHLVTQHVLPADLSTQLRGVISALKPDGTFAMQFSAPTELERPRDYSSTDAKCGGVLYDPKTLEGMVREAGGRVTLSVPKERNLALNWAWHVVHIQPC